MSSTHRDDTVLTPDRDEAKVRAAARTAVQWADANGATTEETRDLLEAIGFLDYSAEAPQYRDALGQV